MTGFFKPFSIGTPSSSPTSAKKKKERERSSSQTAATAVTPHASPGGGKGGGLSSCPSSPDLLKNLHSTSLSSTRSSPSLPMKSKKGKLPTCDLSHKNFGRFPFEELQEKAVGVSSVVLKKNGIETIPSDQLLAIAHSSWRHTLVKLSLSHNLLKEIPREVTLLVNLRVLNLEYNQLSNLPTELTKLRSLEVLRLKENQLVRLPEDCSGWASLHELDLSHNKITRLPRSLACPDNLTSVRLKDNPISYPPPKAFGEDTFSDQVPWAQIRAYLSNPMDFVKRNFGSQVLKGTDSVCTEDNGAVADLTKKVRQLLANKQGRAAFAKFLEKECSLENLLFWEEVEQLLRHCQFIDEEDLKNQSLLIFYKYIKVELLEQREATDFIPSSEINLPFDIKKSCASFFEDAPHLKDVEAYKEILSLAQNNVFQLLALDSFGRFQSTPEYAEALEY